MSPEPQLPSNNSPPNRTHLKHISTPPRSTQTKSDYQSRMSFARRKEEPKNSLRKSFVVGTPGKGLMKGGRKSMPKVSSRLVTPGAKIAFDQGGDGNEAHRVYLLLTLLAKPEISV